MEKNVCFKNCSNLLAITFLLILFACSQNELEQDTIVPVTNAKADLQHASSLSHFISMDSIKSIAMSIPVTFNNKQTKGIEKVIKEILPLSHFVYEVPRTKSENENSDCIYIVNYKEDRGFAIISQDTRIPTVLGYSDNGNITPGEIHDGLAYVLNTLPVYVNQKMEEYQQMIDSLNQYLNVSSLLVRTKAFGDCRYDSLETVVDGTGYDINDPTCNKIINVYDVAEGDWICNGQKGPLYNGIHWHQSYPYNLEIPAKPGCNHALVGCVAIAVAHILAYNQYPSSFTAKGVSYTVDYNNMSTYTCAPFLRGVADAVDMDYGCGSLVNDGGSNSNISKADNALKNIFNYKTGGYTSYNWNDVYTDLDNNRLVYTRGQSDSGGHAWIIDGYYRRSKLTHQIGVVYNNSLNCVVGYRCINETYPVQNLVHCNWGWENRKGDGYFESGIFTPSNPVINEGNPLPSEEHDFINQMIIKNVRR
ncbi:MAG: C10 family peptidase [Parabacteroides sp.]|nr:C10 family peptidase [Parabacteroides sp.]